MTMPSRSRSVTPQPPCPCHSKCIRRSHMWMYYPQRIPDHGVQTTGEWSFMYGTQSWSELASRVPCLIDRRICSRAGLLADPSTIGACPYQSTLPKGDMRRLLKKAHRCSHARQCRVRTRQIKSDPSSCSSLCSKVAPLPRRTVLHVRRDRFPARSFSLRPASSGTFSEWRLFAFPDQAHRILLPWSRNPANLGGVSTVVSISSRNRVRSVNTTAQVS
ncbi:hypothetical protein BDV97DRAFT_21372 [Delphinella strobiligena]|nr:hypothetical protein BDV97DRAFT_21372 [Delphinella strobiligena]